MADVRPFKAYRPTKDLVEQIASLPYDVYSRQEAYELTRGDEHSFLRIDRPETQFAPDYDMYSDEVYEKAKEMLENQIQLGEFIVEDANSYYIYAQTMDGRTQTGIVALSSVQDYLDGVIKKHENTRADKEADRIRHVDICNAQTGPIFLAYRKSEIISSIIEKVKTEAPLYDFVNTNVRQQIWVISDTQDISDIENAFNDMSAIYIADGHHRCASACKVALNRRKDINIPEDSEAEHFLSVLFPDEELMIMDYNRVLKSLNGLSSAEFIEKLSEVYTVELIESPDRDKYSNVKPTSKGECALYIDKQWYSMKYDLTKLTGDPVDDLDVAILQDKILSPVLGIEDPKTDKRIDFVGGIRGLKELERRCESDCLAGIAMYPTDIHELFDVADAGMLMPPKSTWFEPKLLSGIFIHKLG